MKYQLAIIGGGPAGVTAAVYASRKKLSTILITKDFIGQTGRAGVIENYPGEISIDGAELMKKFEDHVKSIDVDIKEETVVSSIHKKEELFFLNVGEEVTAEAVIIASGRNPRPLKVPGEEEFLGKGVSYCAIKDGIQFKGKDVAVIGGGDSGFKAALHLKDYCNKVYILEFASKLRAEEASVERAEKAGVEIVLGARLKEIKGGESVIYIKDGEEKSISVEGVFIEVGSTPASSFVSDLVEFNDKGEIKVDPYTGETKTKGLFAAGDVTDGRDKQITVACGEGVRALASAYNHIQND